MTDGNGKSARRARLAAAVALVGLGLVLAALRVVPSREAVFPDSGGVRLYGVDPYYHLRHARFAAAHFPRLQRWDPGTHYPKGQRSDATGLFDLAIGGLSLAASGGEFEEATVDRVAAWFPVVLALAILPALYRLARTLADRGTALLACALCVAYPGPLLDRTLLGFPDHHVAEVLLGLLATLGLVRALGAARAPDATPAWRPAFLRGLALVTFLFTWNGAAIHVLLLTLALLPVGVLTVVRREDPTAPTRGALRYGLGVLIPVAVLGALVPDLVMDTGRWPATLAGVAVLATALPAFLAAARALGRHGLSPRSSAGLLFVAVAAISAAILTGVPAARALAERLFSPKTELLAEHTTVSLDVLLRWYGASVFLALLGLVAVVGAALRGRRPSEALVVPAVACSLFVLWLRTRDYDYTVPPYIALFGALGLRVLADTAAARLMFRGRSAALAGLTLLALVPLWPLRTAAPPWPTRSILEPLEVIDEGWVQAMCWMRERTPEPTVRADTPVEPWERNDFPYPEDTYGVMTGWAFGNLINTLGNRTPVWSRWPDERTARWLVCKDEERSLNLLCPDCEPGESVRYAAISSSMAGPLYVATETMAGGSVDQTELDGDPLTVGGGQMIHLRFGASYTDSMLHRLYVEDGDDCARYRLVYESPHRSYLAYLASPAGWFNLKSVSLDEGAPRGEEPIGLEESGPPEVYEARVARAAAVSTAQGVEYDGAIHSSVKIFERVEGARLAGTARPGSEVVARLRLRLESTGRELVYSRRTIADESGRFELRVAHATESDSACAAVALGPYAILREGEVELAAEVPLEAVQTGAKVAVSSSH